MNTLVHASLHQVPWNQHRLIGQKPPLKRQEIWAIRIRLQLKRKTRDLALFNFAIDSKLRACDLVSLGVADVMQSRQVMRRACVTQKKTGRPVQFEITRQTREALTVWIRQSKLGTGHFLFPSRLNGSLHLSTRQYARLVKSWVASIGLNPCTYEPILCDGRKPH